MADPMTKSERIEAAALDLLNEAVSDEEGGAYVPPEQMAALRTLITGPSEPRYLYVLVTYAPGNEPYVGVFASADEAREHYNGLEAYEWERGAYFIERHEIGKPRDTEQIESGTFDGRSDR